MPQIVFTSHLRRIVPEGAVTAPGATVAAALSNMLVLIRLLPCGRSASSQTPR